MSTQRDIHQENPLLNSQVPNAAQASKSSWLRCLLAGLLAFGSAGAAFALPFEGRDDLRSGVESLQPDLLQSYFAPLELGEALALVEKGALEDAYSKAHSFLSRFPDSAPGHEVLGIVLVLQDQVDKGMAHLQQAVAINPGQSTAITKIGDVLLARGETEQAKSQFLQAVAVNPDDRFAHQRLGLIYEEEREALLAIEHLEKGLRGTPAGYIGVKMNLGRLYNQVGHYEQAARLLAPVVDETCNNATAHLVLGSAWFGLRRTDRALACFERARELSAGEGIRLALGIAYREAGEHEKSRNELEGALEERPDWPAARFQLGETLVALKQVDEAMENYEKAAAVDGRNPMIPNRMAEVFAISADYDKALAKYRSIQAAGAANLRTYAGMSALLQVSGQLAEAEQVLLEAKAEHPGDARAGYLLGMHYAFVRDYDRAAQILQEARRASPADPRIQKAISLIAVRKGDKATAIAEARRLLQIVPGSIEDRFYLASLLEGPEGEREAAALYQEVLAASPDHVGALNNLAMVRLRAGDASGALELAQKAAALAPHAPAVLDTLGWVQYQNRDLDGARKALESAVAKGEAAAHRYHLAVVLNELGERAKSLEQLDAALSNETHFTQRAAAQELADRLRSTP